MLRDHTLHDALSKFANIQFQKKLDITEDFAVYELKYYELGLNIIEEIHEGEYNVGRLLVKRQYVFSSGVCNNMFTYYTNIRDSTVDPSQLRASVCIVHGYGENSDIFLESALQYALNGFDVHLVDLRGFGMTGGTRMAGNKLSDLHYDVIALLKQVQPQLPLFIYGHSMGGLTVFSFLVNNPNFNIQGVILSAPFLDVNRTMLDDSKRKLVKFLAPHLDVSMLAHLSGRSS